MSHIWPLSTIRELIALAESTGSSQAELGSAEEARLFRFAIYSFRRTNMVGEGLSVTLDGNKVILTKRQTPLVFISNPTIGSDDWP